MLRNNKSNKTELWLVSSWATTTVLNTAKWSVAACGTTAAALCFGGYGDQSTTEIWDGSTWSTTTSKTESRYGHAGCGTTSDALSFGGVNTKSTTERWIGVGNQLGFAAKIN